MSARWWRSKHSRHHEAPNQLGKDPDIDDRRHRVHPGARRQRTGFQAWLTRRQGWLFFPLLTLEGLSLYVSSVQHLLRRSAT